MFGNLITFIIGIKIIDTFLYKKYDPSSFMIPIRLDNRGIVRFRNKTDDFLKLFSQEFQPYVYKNHHIPDPDPDFFSEFNVLFLLL